MFDALRRRKVPFVPQMEMTECGPACLTMVLRFHGCRVPLSKVRQECGSGRDGVSALVLKQAAARFGLETKAYRVHYSQLSDITLPAILHWQGYHYVVLECLTRRGAWIVDPASGRQLISLKTLEEHFSGVVLTFVPGTNFVPRNDYKISWRYYLNRLWEDRRLLFYILLTTFLMQAMGLLLPYFTYLAVDSVILARNLGLLPTIGIGMIGIAIVQGLTVYLKGVLTSRLQARISLTLSRDFISHMFSLPLGFFEQRSSGDLITRVNNIIIIREILSGSSVSVLLDGLLIITHGMFMLFISPSLTILAVAVGMIQMGLMLVLAPRIRNLTRQELSAQAEANSYLMEALRGMMLVKATGGDRKILETWNALLVKQVKWGMYRDRTRAILDGSLNSLRVSMPLVFLTLGTHEIVRGEQTLGMLLGFNALALAFMLHVTSLIGSLQQLQLLSSIVERLQDVLEAKPENTEKQPCTLQSTNVAIRFEGVTFSYNHYSSRILDGINLCINPGQKVALVGPTGSGKSTFVKLLLGLYLPTKGRILYGNVDLSQLDRTQLRQMIGVVLQESHLFHDTIARNIAFYRDIPRSQIEWAAKMALLHEEILKMPMGYDTLIGENGLTLSGGQRQRLAIARALAGRPSILLLDEATSNLDVATQGALEQNIRQLGITRIVVAHRLSTVIDADQIIVLNKGRIIEQGTHEELIRLGGFYAQLWGRQISTNVISEIT
ncbi:MAG: peptidase domain-containing ABC transporter [Clostridiales bacterium]|nr:peptidase domain-containing ABC transporter [Clostridiales bacterium]